MDKINGILAASSGVFSAAQTAHSQQISINSGLIADRFAGFGLKRSPAVGLYQCFY
jgi:hypothetical protein